MVAVIIPTLNAEKELPVLLKRLAMQIYPPDELLVVDSCSTDGTREIACSCPCVRLITVSPSEFDHGTTRDWAFRQTKADFVCFLTQDALPMEDTYLQCLLTAFADERVAAVCGRQVARENARPEERLTRIYNYPATSFTRSREDLPRLGIKTFFLSDACSAYRRTAYEQVGGFEHGVRTNEDMLIAAKLIAADWRIAYCAEARVRHSHSLTLRQEYRRNYEVGAFLKAHEAVLMGAKAESEGVRYVHTVALGLLKECRIFSFLRFGAICAAKLLGNRMGSRAQTKCHPSDRGV